MTETMVPAATSRDARQDRRLRGLDAARGLAVIGMIVVHVSGGAPLGGGLGGTVFGIAEGRSAILFAVLAGVSLGLLSGGRRGLAEHRAGTREQRDRTRIAVRAVLLFVLGVALAAISSGPIVILSYYAVLFALALPLLWLRPGALLAWAAGWALVGPQVSFLLRTKIHTDELGGAVAPVDLTSWGAAGDAVLRLLLTGTYPVATWMPFVLAGLAIGRLDLRSAAVRARLAIAGVAAAVIGYGGSWLAVDVLGGREALIAALAPLATQVHLSPEQLVELTTSSSMGTSGTLTPAFLLVDAPHSGTTFEVIGSTGVAVAVLALCLMLAERGRVTAAVEWPLAAAGAMAATIYAGHIAVMALLTAAVPSWQQQQPWLATVLFVVVAILLALAWRRLIGRGPVEWVLHTVSTRAGRSGRDQG
ncbi:DUF418 domain-containing protein [Pseudonocardia xinjiangensis]|uniref:DUF418 domain-containing protein n=1 Tax=Pseudonocardia xinjiangensis TaxID=75289 RepID=UPI003D91BF51